MDDLVGCLVFVDVGLQEYLEKVFSLVFVGHYEEGVGKFWLEVLAKQASLDKF